MKGKYVVFNNLIATEENCLKTAKSIDELKKLPIVMYGAGIHALSLSNFLKKHFSVNIAAYFVDEQYLRNTHNVEGVMAIEQIQDKFAQFNIIIGFDGNPWLAKEKLEKQHYPQINAVYIYDHSIWQSFEHLDLKYLKEKQADFQQTYNLLSDEKSRQIFTGYINTKITLDLSHLQNLSSFPQYFPDDLPVFSPCSDDIFIDGGAYDGDTLKSFLSKVDNCQQYYAFEPDTSNYEKLAAFIQKNSLTFAKAIQAGLWNQDSALSFQGNDGTSSVISETGHTQITVKAIDSLGVPATFIKMDIEGAEFEALKGAEQTIRQYKPKLAISLYHHPEHLTQIPLFLKSLCPEYKFYLRIHSFYSRELVLYATTLDSNDS